jgi:purine-nucleoside phosphorylase
MSTHIGARPGEIAETVLLPGDPLRAKWIAETFLDEAVQYSDVRNMFGYTGIYNGSRVSVQGTGMGMPSCAIYVHELLEEYGAKTLVRIGSCGALTKEVDIHELIIAVSASTDSAINKSVFGDTSYAPTADFALTRHIADTADKIGLQYHAGPIVSGDAFYRPMEGHLDVLADHGALGVEMESAVLFRLAAKFKARAACILSVSDHLITGEDLSSEERQTGFTNMAKLALQSVTT